jgi:hypothetical protein
MKSWQIEYPCSAESIDGKSLNEKILKLTILSYEDGKVLSKKGMEGLRLERIQRLTREAEEQGGQIGYEDLSAILFTPVSVLRRDISELRSQGKKIPLLAAE